MQNFFLTYVKFSAHCIYTAVFSVHTSLHSVDSTPKSFRDWEKQRALVTEENKSATNT